MDIHITIITIGYILSAILTLALGFFVWFKNKKGAINILWLILSTSVFIWEAGDILAFNAPTEKLAYFFWFGELADIFIAILYSHFVLHFIGKAQEKKKIIFAMYLVGVAIFIRRFKKA